MQGQAQRIRPIGDRDQGHVVGHQAVAHQAQAVALAVGGQRGQVEATVLVDEKNVLAMVASLCDVVWTLAATTQDPAEILGHGSLVLC